MNQLLIFTIGPVQSFIESSRKTKDMFAASRLLSQTIYDAIEWLNDSQNTPCTVKIIFPVVLDTSAGLNIPNRLIAQFADCSEAELAVTAQKLAQQVRKNFFARCEGILRSAGVESSGVQLAMAQLTDFLEIYWLFERFDDETSYIEAYNRLYNGIQAVKNVRPFVQTNEPWGRKCTLFPQYNAIFARRNTDKRYPYHVNEQYVYELPLVLNHLIKTNEALSAIALVKRLYQPLEHDIYSLRLMMLKNRLQGKIYLDQISDDIANVVYDFYNDNVLDLDKYREKHSEEYSEETIEKAHQLYTAIESQQITLSSYYALIKFDGDNMGDIFKTKLTTAEQHRELSQKLSAFAKQAPDILLSYQGLPVYAGGEDFFGFLPLDNLFDALVELDAAFQKTTGLTFSVGIVVAHLMQPLKDVVAEADRQEKTAKALEQKHAFALGLLKRSGEFVALSAYKLSDSNGPVLKDMQQLVTALKACHYPKSLLYNIGQLLEPLSLSEPQPPWAMVAPLIEQIMVRSEISADHAAALLTDLQLFYQDKPLRAFLDTLNAAAFIAREVK